MVACRGNDAVDPSRRGHLLSSVLLVESDSPRAAAMARALEPLGLALTTLAEGERVLDRARAQRPDLVIASSALADMSGFSLCNRLRRLPGLADLPIMLIPSPSDGPATEAHRAGKTPATDYLPLGAGPDDLVRHVAGLLNLDGGADLSSLAGLEDEPIQLDRSAPPPAPAPPSPAPRSQTQGIAARPPAAPPPSSPSRPPLPGPPPLKPAAGPPPMPKGPPPLKGGPPRPGTAAPAMTQTQHPPRPDPFADVPADPRLPMGASPEDKVQYFRERLKAREDLLSKVREAHQLVRGDADLAERDLALARNENEELRRALAQYDQRDKEQSALLQQLQQALDQAQGEISRGAYETASVRQDAEERAQSLSELLNAAMREREEDGKRAAQKISESERKLALLQEEVDHLAAAHEGANTNLEQVRDELQKLRQSSQEESAALQEQFAQLQSEKEAIEQDLAAQKASLALKEADLASESGRIAELTQQLEQLAKEARESQDAWAEARQSYADQLAEAERQRSDFESRAQEAEAKQSELRGEIEAIQQMNAETAATEGRVVELEAEIASRDEELAGLRTKFEEVAAEREQLQDDLGSQLAQLAAESQAKDREIQKLQQALSGITGLQQKLGETEGRAQTAEQRAQELEGQLEAAEAKARDAEALAEDARQRAEGAQAAIADAEARAEEAESTARAAQERAREMEAAAQDTHGQASEASQHAESARRKAHVAETELAELRGTAEAQAQHFQDQLQEVEGRMEAAEARVVELERELAAAHRSAKQAETARAKAERELQTAQAQPPPSPVSSVAAPSKTEKQLRVRVSDLMEEVKALKAKLQKGTGAGDKSGSAELERLREELEAAKAENEFLTTELERAQEGGGNTEELTSPGGMPRR